MKVVSAADLGSHAREPQRSRASTAREEELCSIH